MTFHLPEGWEDGAARSPALDASGEVTLASAYELDDAPSFERFFLVYGEEPFEVAAAAEAARRLAARPDEARRGRLEPAPRPAAGLVPARQGALTPCAGSRSSSCSRPSRPREPRRPMAAAPSPLRRFALVAGSNDGGAGRVRLRYAATDAQAMARVLRELGGVRDEDLVLLVDPDLTDVHRGAGPHAPGRAGRRARRASGGRSSSTTRATRTSRA